MLLNALLCFLCFSVLFNAFLCVRCHSMLFQCFSSLFYAFQRFFQCFFIAFHAFPCFSMLFQYFFNSCSMLFQCCFNAFSMLFNALDQLQCFYLLVFGAREKRMEMENDKQWWSNQMQIKCKKHLFVQLTIFTSIVSTATVVNEVHRRPSFYRTNRPLRIPRDGSFPSKYSNKL